MAHPRAAGFQGVALRLRSGRVAHPLAVGFQTGQVAHPLAVGFQTEIQSMLI